MSKEQYAFGLGAVVCLTALEITALVTHTDGAYFAPIMTAIGAIVGGLLGLSFNFVKTTVAPTDDDTQTKN